MARTSSTIQPMLAVDNTLGNLSTWTKNKFLGKDTCLTPLLTLKYKEHIFPHLTQAVV